MACKFIILSAFLFMAVNALHLFHQYKEQKKDHYYHPKYKFAYKVEDHQTGDIKSQEEIRDGDRVAGYYSLIEPDVHKRIIHYAADKHLGFHATVHRALVHKSLN